MKVNMTPNPLDVVTIHASQGDTEARQWEFELHNNGELIDTSDVKEQLVFKAYKGGTEQLLPENGSTPTTSPFKGDIRYPQGLLADQEFTYRQSPTEEDGLAFVERIKGNTIIKDNTLISFNGTALKAVGKNLFDENSVLLSQGFVKQNDGSYYKDILASLSNAIVWKNDAHINGAINVKFKYKNIYTSGSQGLRIIVLYTDGTTQTVYTPVASEFALLQHQTNSSKTVDKIVWDYGSSANGTYIKDFIISVDNIGYEPYTSSTLSLPISTYFPNGMNGVGTDYDELTNTKATTRMTRVDLGTLDWGVSNGTMYANLPDAYLPSTGTTVANAICPKYTTAPLNYVIAKSQDKILALNNGQPRVNVYDSAYTDATAFKTAMSGVYLVYPLATPTETSFTTASLVTENGEIPLSNEDGTLIGKCTEELSAEPGFHDAKIKLTDSDGTCYSNKLQLHIERSPQ